MENLKLYEAVRTPPKEALKSISAGRLKGMTDINPMWRIQMLTEQFGPCGIGWKYSIVREWTEAATTGEIAAFMDILLFYKWNGEWSEGVPGTGGSSFVANEKAGLHMSDECYKMALTDAISVAAKALGFAADIYWQSGRSKYGSENESHVVATINCSDCGSPIEDGQKRNGEAWSAGDIVAYSKKRFGKPLCPNCQRKAFEQEKAAETV